MSLPDLPTTRPIGLPSKHDTLTQIWANVGPNGAKEMARGVPPALSKPDLSQFATWLKRHPVPII